MSPATEMMMAAAGGAGAVARYGLGQLAVNRAMAVTLLINVAGSLLLGWVVGTMEQQGQEAVWLVAAGFCGGFTTFSSFALQVQNIGSNDVVERRFLKAGALVLAHICFCLAAALFGWRIAG